MLNKITFLLQGISSVFILNNLERRKDKLKTQLVWIGAQKEPQITARTWRWVDGKLDSKIFTSWANYSHRQWDRLSVGIGPKERRWATRGEIWLTRFVVRQLSNNYRTITRHRVLFRKGDCAKKFVFRISSKELERFVLRRWANRVSCNHQNKLWSQVGSLYMYIRTAIKLSSDK